MTEMDANGDGTVSHDEMLAAMPERAEAVSAQIDTNGDGNVDAEEYAAAREAGFIATGG